MRTSAKIGPVITDRFPPKPAIRLMAAFDPLGTLLKIVLPLGQWLEPRHQVTAHDSKLFAILANPLLVGGHDDQHIIEIFPLAQGCQNPRSVGHAEPRFAESYRVSQNRAREHSGSRPP